MASQGDAQAGRGTLTGTVTDAQGAALQGARISVTPGNLTAISDASGQFTLLGVPIGSDTVTVSYAGFQALTRTVTISSTQSSARLDVSLVVASTQENVQVYAGRQGGELEAISRTFNAPNIINVLPADVITSLPNANVADAIGRLPDVTLERDEGEGKYVKVRGTEPRLTHTTLDGVTLASPELVRQIKLDLIPADLVESVQINKTLQANMEGAGIGGSVDLRTKSAEDRPTMYLESTGGYTPILTGRPAYQFDGTYGKRFLAGKKLGALGSASYDWNGRGINDVEPGPALAGSYDLRDYRYFRDRWGAGGTVDYRLSDTSNLFLKGLYSHFNNFGDDWIYTPSTNFVLPGGSSAGDGFSTQGDGNGSIAFTALKRRPVQDIGGIQFGGHHILGRTLFNWDVNSSVGRTRDDGYSFYHFAPAGNVPLNQGILFALDNSNPLIPHLNAQDGKNIFDPTQFFYKDKEVENTYNSETDLGFGASLSIPYTIRGHENTFEFGGLFRNEHKFINQNTQWFAPLIAAANPSDPSLALTNFRNDFADPNYYGGHYGPYPFTASVGGVDAYTAVGADPAHGNTFGNGFDQVEKVSAGYVMNTAEIGRFRIYLGLRIESTGENNVGYLGTSRSGTPGSTPIRATYSYINLLPSASVRYALTPTQGLRLVYSRGLARPDFQDLIPFESAPSGTGRTSSVSRGNPFLNAEYADDIDVLYENNLSGSGLLQAGFYYKNLVNPIVGTTSVAPADSVDPTSHLLNGVLNAGSGYVYGFEVAFLQRFTRLPGLFNGLGVSANYGYTNSAAHLPPYIDPSVLKDPSTPVGTISGPNRGPEGANPALIGQAPNSYNFSPTYDKRKLSVRLGMTYNQANIAAYQYDTGNSGPIVNTNGNFAGGGTKGPNGDQYFYSHLQVDLQGSYQLPKNLTFVMYALNLNNEVFGFYNGGTNFPIQREFYRQTIGGGLRWSPHREGR